MEIPRTLDKSKLEFIIVLSLIVISCLLTYYFYFVLHTSHVFSHFFYIPIILSALWWQYKGLPVAFFLSSILVITPLLAGFYIENIVLVDNIFRAVLLILIGCVVAIMSKQISKSHDALKSRVRELSCLYRISRLMSNPNLSVDEIMQGILEKINCAWRFPKLSCAKIEFEGRKYSTENYKNTPWKMSNIINIGRDKELTINIHYLEEEQFIEEEIKLLDEISQKIKGIFELKLAWIK